MTVQSKIDPRATLLEINAPQWFVREDFVRALEDDASPIATWHRKGRPVRDYADAFVTYDNGEGSDADNLPADIWAAICAEAERHGMVHGIVWLKNLG